MRNEGDLKVGAYQLPPQIVLAAHSTDALFHKESFINYYLSWVKKIKKKKYNNKFYYYHIVLLQLMKTNKNFKYEIQQLGFQDTNLTSEDVFTFLSPTDSNNYSKTHYIYYF